MPGARMKRSAVKRRAGRAAVARRRARRKLRMNNGMLTLTRRISEQNIYNTAVAGTAAASGSVVTIGTPYQTPPFAGSPYYNIPFSCDVVLADLLNYTELTALADKYKINWVKLKVYATSNTASAGGSAQLPSILYSLDEDDATVPASSTTGLNALREKMSSKLRQFKQNGSGFNIFFKPKIMNVIGGAGGVTTAISAPISAPYIDCSNVDVPHYGVKGYLQDVNLTATPSSYTQFKFDITVSLTLKDIQ